MKRISGSVLLFQTVFFSFFKILEIILVQRQLVLLILGLRKKKPCLFSKKKANQSIYLVYHLDFSSSRVGRESLAGLGPLQRDLVPLGTKDSQQVKTHAFFPRVLILF